MQIKYKKVISYFLIALILFSGMFCENILEDSFFGYTTASHSEATIDSYNATLSETAACTSEMLGLRSFSFVQQFANKSMTKVVVRFAFNCMLIQCILHIYSNFFLTAHIVQFQKLYGQTVLVNYIHNKDGKK